MKAGRATFSSGTGVDDLELGEEADVFFHETPEVLELMAHERQPVDAEAEREAGPTLRIDPGRLEDRRMDHPAAAELDPAGVRTGPTARPMADRAGDLQLRRRLGEGKVRRPQTR